MLPTTYATYLADSMTTGLGRDAARSVRLAQARNARTVDRLEAALRAARARLQPWAAADRPLVIGR